MVMLKSVCVFCGSSLGSNPAYAHAARELGELLAREHLRLVYGGGSVGLMGALADAALAARGEVIGVIPHALQARELGHPGLTRLEVVGSMHERKARMGELAEAFVALPGGMGTLEELCEVVTWAQLGIHRKPCGVLNVAGFFDRFVELLDHATSEGFLQPAHRDLVRVEREPGALLERLRKYEPPEGPVWLSPPDPYAKI